MIRLFLLLLLAHSHVCAQVDLLQQIQSEITRRDSEAHLRFIAADEMGGRDVGSPGLNNTANYIRAQFICDGLKEAPGTLNFFQPVNFTVYDAPKSASIIIGKDAYSDKNNLIVLNGGNINWNGDFVYVGYGSEEDLSNADIKGKMVLALAGSRDSDDINKAYRASRAKYTAMRKAGAAGLIEFVTSTQAPWSALSNFFTSKKWNLKDEYKDIPLIWLKPQKLSKIGSLKERLISGSVFVDVDAPRELKSQNVAALLEGTDPKLKNEYIIITAHYDHIGTDVRQKGDSIFNGARDNATGTVALLHTANFLSKHQPKRSVIFVTLTAEEKGTLGSQWYVSNPLIPLERTVLNLNCDGVGYNDKSIITSISLGRTNMDKFLVDAAQNLGFNLRGDPDPSEGFYERSDQVSFAKAGVPAIKLQPGLAQMDEQIRQYYHRPGDEVESMDLDYINRFYQAFVYAATLIANDSTVPAWGAGDKFEPAYKQLYRR